ncbi:hypothetical protein [Nocardia paucivorans]|uniref:hypothetical protein n=1 Tax=Nocardia paucivorans TaxID=114259 RepID=UPI0002DAAA80|nr:hypothetical protein [Nocardia paucivorans]
MRAPIVHMSICGDTVEFTVIAEITARGLRRDGDGEAGTDTTVREQLGPGPSASGN